MSRNNDVFFVLSYHEHRVIKMSWSAIPGIYRKFETDATIAGKIWVVGSIACRYVAQYRQLLFISKV